MFRRGQVTLRFFLVTEIYKGDISGWVRFRDHMHKEMQRAGAGGNCKNEKNEKNFRIVVGLFSPPPWKTPESPSYSHAEREREPRQQNQENENVNAQTLEGFAVPKQVPGGPRAVLAVQMLTDPSTPAAESEATEELILPGSMSASQAEACAATRRTEAKKAAMEKATARTAAIAECATVKEAAAFNAAVKELQMAYRILPGHRDAKKWTTPYLRASYPPQPTPQIWCRSLLDCEARLPQRPPAAWIWSQPRAP